MVLGRFHVSVSYYGFPIIPETGSDSALENNRAEHALSKTMTDLSRQGESDQILRMKKRNACLAIYQSIYLPETSY
jgi:hypothetical protein